MPDRGRAVTSVIAMSRWLPGRRERTAGRAADGVGSFVAGPEALRLAATILR
jgi:hypothetical protein